MTGNSPFKFPAPSAQVTRALWDEPPAAYRGKPFWSWNGELEIPELKRQVEVFKSMGMGGFFMHSRTGLVTEYLGEEWFEAINAVADEGSRLGMEAWIYDEDRWPSGSAGGLATEEEAFRMKVLRCRVAFQGAGDRQLIPWGDFSYTVTEADRRQGYVTCELILTRRNTFGPLHHTNREMTWVSPSAFRSEGEQWTDDYVLIPAGLESISFQPLNK